MLLYYYWAFFSFSIFAFPTGFLGVWFGFSAPAARFPRFRGGGVAAGWEVPRLEAAAGGSDPAGLAMAPGLSPGGSRTLGRDVRGVAV